jgi:methanethiol S-methyltransferase
MSRVFAIAGGLVFAASLVYFGVTYTRDFDGSQPWSWAAGWRPLAFDVALFTLFAVHHSIFARSSVKGWMKRAIRPELERSVYTWVASLLFLAVCAAWRPVPGVLWRVSSPWLTILRGAQIVSTIFVLLAARRLDPLALAGVAQLFDRGTSRPTLERPAPDPLVETGAYGFVRHPIYFGWFVVVWCAPVMNGTRLVFAAVSCLYLLLAVPFEERDLRRTFGPAYERYAARVRWRVLPGLF